MALRPVAWSAVVGAAFAVVIAVPAFSDPPSVPDGGSRPAPIGELQLPGVPSSSTPVVAPVPGPLANQVMDAEIEVATLGEQLKSLGEQLTAAQQTRSDADRAWQEATERLSELREASDSAAAKAYKDADQLRPFDPEGSALLRDLGKLIPRTVEPELPEITPWDLSRAEAEEQERSRAYADATLQEQGLTDQYASRKTSFEQRQAALIKLKQDNAAQLALIEAERDRYERSLAGQYGDGTVDGKAANPKALQAMQYALRQLGKWYEWAAEGPNTFDCSGLMWAAYRSVGYTLPRVANDQYHATTPVPRDKLLPGDMVFFATNFSDWRTIYHVGMYVGDGQMVEAPTTGVQVRIYNVRWSHFFGASRVFPAVPAPQTTTPPATTKPPTTKPPTTTPPATTKPPTTTPPTSTSPSPTQLPSSAPSSNPPSSNPPSSKPPASKPPSDAPRSAPPSAAQSPSEPDAASSRPASATASPS